VKTVRDKKCKICGNNFKPFKTTQRVCSQQCAITYAKEKEKEKEAKAWRKEKARRKADLMTYSQRLNKARRVFQKWIRERDKDKPCISCGTITSSLWDAGHYLKAEVFSGLIFDEDNVHKQCRKCNRYLSGNEVQYRLGLIKRIGEERVLALESKANEERLKKYTNQELQEIQVKYK